MKAADNYGMQSKTDNELIDILNNRQDIMIYEALIAAKKELQKREIDTSYFSIREKKPNESKKARRRKPIFSLLNALFYFSVFGIVGICLTVYGYRESDYFIMILGMAFSAPAIFILSKATKIKWISYVSYIIMIIPAVSIILLQIAAVAALIFLLIYFPFFDKSNLDIDFEILILKDGFVRFLIILIDMFLLYKGWNYLKERKKYKKT